MILKLQSFRQLLSNKYNVASYGLEQPMVCNQMHESCRMAGDLILPRLIPFKVMLLSFSVKKQQLRLPSFQNEQ